MQNQNCVSYNLRCRPVVPGGAGVAMAPLDFGRSVNPDYAPTSPLAPLDFQTFLRSWEDKNFVKIYNIKD